MLIAQITDTHIKTPGKLAYHKVDTAALLRQCVAHLLDMKPQPDLILLTGDLVDLGSAEEYAHLKSILAPLPQRIIAIPGNHDARETMRDAFFDAGYLPNSGFLQFVLDDYPLRILGLDTLIPGESGGELCVQRREWLEATLKQKPLAPTLVVMHHPPFETGIVHMDRIGLKGSAEFSAIVARQPQIKGILCGHLHRAIFANVGGRPAMTCPSPAHQVTLDLDPDAPSGFSLEPPCFFLHRWERGHLITHTAFIGRFDGPHPFFSSNGRLLD